jgi:hypothetical protein
MKRYVSLAGALLVGTVVGKERKHFKGEAVAAKPSEIQAAQAAVLDAPIRYDSIDRRSRRTFDVEYDNYTENTYNSFGVENYDDDNVSYLSPATMGTYESIGVESFYDDEYDYDYDVKRRSPSRRSRRSPRVQYRSRSYRSRRSPYAQRRSPSFRSRRSPHAQRRSPSYRSRRSPRRQVRAYDYTPSYDRFDNEDVIVKIERGYAGVCGIQYNFPVGDTYWCDDRQLGLRTHCVVQSSRLHLCCIETDGCDDLDDMKAWRW